MIYHAQVQNDQEARRVIKEQAKDIQALGGDLTASYSTGAGDTFLVLDMPDGDAAPDTLFTAYSWKEVHTDGA